MVIELAVFLAIVAAMEAPSSKYMSGGRTSCTVHTLRPDDRFDIH
jgi:hypothetical protein